MVQVLDRLAPQDLHRQIDWLRDEWDDDELIVAKKLVRLRRLLEQLPSRYYERSVPHLEGLAHARLVRESNYYSHLRSLNELVEEWDRNRPPLLHCERCTISVRGHEAMRRHVELIHYGEAGT